MESRDPVKRWILRHKILTVVLGIAGLIIIGAALGYSEDSSTSSGPSQASTESTSSSRCEPMPSVAADFLESALFGKQLVGPVVVRSDDFKHVYFVAGRVDGESALWAMNQLDGGGLIMSINQHAYDVSEMEFGETTDAHVTEDDDGASEALGCVAA